MEHPADEFYSPLPIFAHCGLTTDKARTSHAEAYDGGIVGFKLTEEPAQAPGPAKKAPAKKIDGRRKPGRDPTRVLGASFTHYISALLTAAHLFLPCLPENIIVNSQRSSMVFNNLSNFDPNLITLAGLFRKSDYGPAILR